MINLTVLSRAMAGHLARATGLARERIDTLRFGLEIILCALIKGLVLFSLAHVLGIIAQVAAALVTAGSFRLLTGGAHCSSYGRCLVFGVTVYLLIGKMALTSAIFFTPAVLIALVCFVTFAGAVGIVKYAPSTVPYRTMNSPQEVIVFKALSLLFLILWNGLTMYFIKLNQSIILAAAFGLIIQIFSFTPWGRRAIIRLEGLMSKLTSTGGEKNACA